MLHVLLTGLTIQLPHAYQKVRQISNGSYSAVSIVVERGTEGPLLAAKTVQDTTLEGIKGKKNGVRRTPVRFVKLPCIVW